MSYYPKPRQPCDKHCKDRNGECHATCEKYKAFADEMEKYRQAKINSHEEYEKKHTSSRKRGKKGVWRT